MNKKRLVVVMFVCGLLVAASWPSAQTITPNALTSFRFVAWGDSRSSGSSGVDTPVLSSLSNQVNGLSPAFTIFDGDLCSTWDSTCTSTGSSGWRYAVNDGSPGNGLFNKTLAWRGNHDDSASGWDSYFNFQSMVTAIGGTSFGYYSSDGADRTYSFDYGNSHFVGIDMPGGDISTMNSGQISWLDADITSAEGRGVTHTFVLDHGPIYYVDGHSSTPSSSLINVLNKHASLSATFHGHEHLLAYVHIDSSRISGVTHPWEEFVSGNSGAPEYSCSSGRSDFCTQTQGFASVDVNGNSFTVSFYYLGSSNPAKTWTFTKGAVGSVTLSPSTVAFGNQTVNTASAPRTVTLNNGTAQAMNISNIAITGTNGGDFAQTNNCGSSLASSASCTINVEFTPATTGTRTATLTVTDNAAGSPHTASLSGTGVTTTVSVSPSSLTFPSQTVGTTSAVQFSTLTNSGTTTLTINSLTISGDFAFGGTGTCGSTLAAGSNCTISVVFKPTATGTRTGAVTISDSAPNSPQTISLSGTGAAAGSVSVTPTSLSFPSTTVGTSSAAQPVTLSNTTSSAVSISSIAITGSNSGDFAQTNGCGASVAANGSCTISVTFKPTATGTRAATLTITPASGSALTVSLSGTGASSSGGGSVTITPNPLTFPNTTVGATSAVGTATLTNNTSSAITVAAAFTITGPFAFGGTGNCPAVGSSIAAGGSCTLSAKFSPTAAGTQTGSMTIPLGSGTQTLTLSGTGVSSAAPAVSLSPASLSFPSQTVNTTSAAKTVTLSNTGNATLNISSLNVSGEFAFAGSGTCATSVAAGANCTITVNFTPTATGTRTGAVTITDNAANSPQSIPLSGTGASPGSGSATVSVSPSSLSFGKVRIGATSAAQTVTVTNTGSTTVSFSGITTTGPFGVTTNCTSLASGSCAINVTASPTATGWNRGTLIITDNATGSPQTVSLSCQGSKR